MLRQVFITKDGEIIFQRDYGKALDAEGFSQAYKQIASEAFKVAVESTKYHDFFRYRIGYLAVPERNIIFFFVSDLSDKFSNIEKELVKCRKEFINMFGPILDEQIDADTFEIFDPTIELIHKNLRPKISLVGFSGVGKTTITRLITAQDIPTEHVPTITGDIGTIKIGKLHFHLWDFAGQEQFSFLWNNFIKGSDGVLMITDSTLENCEKSRYFTELIKKEAPYAHAACIGNKQDLPDAMPIADIERLIGMKAYSMIAVDPDNRNKMITIIADILEMSGEISPLLKPLIERDKILLRAEAALEDGNFQKSMELFDELADLSLELGDDRVSQDFHEKATKIRTILQQFSKSESTPAPPPAPPPETPSAPTPIPSAPAPVPPSSANMPPVITPPLPTAGAPQITPPPAPGVSGPVKPDIMVPAKAAVIPPAPSIVAPPAPSIVAPPAPSIVAPPAPSIVAPPAPPSPLTKITPSSAPAPFTPLATPINTPPPPAAIIPTPPPTKDDAKVDKLDLLLNQVKNKNDQKLVPEVNANAARSPSVLSPDSKYAQPLDTQILKPTIPPPSAPLSAPPTATIPHPAPVSASPTSTLAPPTAPSSAPSAESVESSRKTRQLITDLKIKIANVNKTMLDLEMQNITGDLSDEIFANKSQRLEAMKEKIASQIKELEQL
ncbi:MAG: ADP-ribosylation factor-like protein [Promethearchaeota archaeon]